MASRTAHYIATLCSREIKSDKKIFKTKLKSVFPVRNSAKVEMQDQIYCVRIVVLTSTYAILTEMYLRSIKDRMCVCMYVCMTTSMYILYVGFDYTYIEINALAQEIKSFLASQVCFQAVVGTRTYGTDSPAITSQAR